MKIAVVGLGQIGGSVALKLRETGENPDLFDIDDSICRRIGGKREDFRGHGYDLVVLALHTDILLEEMKTLPRDNLYLDTASVKVPVVEAASANALKLIGGHPIAGNERKGPDSWDPGMFEGRPFALVDTGAGKAEKDTAETLVRLLGAVPEWTDAEFHDLALAHTSHAPYFVSCAIKSVGRPYEKFSGPGYDSMTRLARQDPALGRAFGRYNTPAVADVLEKVSKKLADMAEELRK